MACNSAAWLTAAKATPFEVKPAPLWTPGENEILVRNHAVAINPVDGSLQAFAWWPFEYPTILGQDVAGVVKDVGPNVTRFKRGDRIVGHAVGMATKRNQDNGFQAYTIVPTNMAAELPESISFQDAAVIPLAFSTASCGLFQDAFLKLQPPAEPPQNPTGETLLVWGGSSSVGSNAIQLAIAAGYEVIVTASPKNFNYVKKLGAAQVFDYSNPTIVDELVGAFKGRTVAGAMDCIGGAATKACAEVVQKSSGRKFVSTTKGGFEEPPEGVAVKNVFGTTLKDNNVGKMVYVDFLPKALRAGSFVPAPAPLVVGKGLESVQGGVDIIRKGVSAQKLVVLL
ncbi:putative secondary metabolism biosynthetic enzyme [Coccidioides posadasii str. Silveira]|uniref:Zinc-binding oxidoreductase CipB n=2 Tax=Coccidioides posadasii TaxID=199306 RepID=E9CRH4_COCPS|nr:zinc-binding oxidoreductase CipB [Coccidioides posadasii str. Silveira]KMM68123.1 zinc-binding oxidoreductase CipB [Coccidioides posadasii RMSCC 3488]QVM12116.1 putative secondary metabolism biosynthetic enzyme [Coccidioides posadasii str. Silveira]